MSSFFYHSAQTLISKYQDRFPLLKITQILDWQSIESLLNKRKIQYLRDHGGRPSYPLLPMFRAILLGQWHSLSDPELERSLVTRLDFMLFCDFPDEMNLPDHSTLNRFRNWLIQDHLLDELLVQINQQLAQKQLKVQQAQTAIVDASIIQTAGGKQKKAIEVEETVSLNECEEQNNKPAAVTIKNTPASKDVEARWTIKNKHWYLGYKLHMCTDEEGFVTQIHVTPANVADVNHLETVLDNVTKGATVFADKGYDSQYNREFLERNQLKDGIMRKAHRAKALTREDIIRNKRLSKIRYRVEQSFAILHRKFRCKRASYFGVAKVKGQMLLKAMCLNLLKAANKLRLVAPIAA